MHYLGKPYLKHTHIWHNRDQKNLILSVNIVFNGGPDPIERVQCLYCPNLYTKRGMIM